MPLLRKFIAHHSSTTRGSTVSSTQDAQLSCIIANLQTVLQSRRTFANGQNIGINDFSEQLLGEALLHSLCADIVSQIDKHEPRLSQVTVKLVQSTDYLWRMEVKARLKQGHHLAFQKSPESKQVRFILELVKPAYINQLVDIPVEKL